MEYICTFEGLKLLDAQPLSVQRCQTLTRRLAISYISPLFVERLGRSLRFCHLEFKKEAIYDSRKKKKTRYIWRILNFK